MALTYSRRLLSFARRESSEEIRGHLRSSVLTVVASLALGGSSGAATGGVVGALLGGIGGPLLVAAGLFLWKLATAPARIYAEQEAKIAALSAKTSAKDEVSAADEVKRRVRHALHRLFDAYHDLEIVSNRTNDNAWNTLSQRLEDYRAAYTLLPAVARRFHERSEPALAHFVRDRKFERLSECMNDASDIMLNGECELDLTISRPTAIVVTNRASRRDRFIIINIIVGNREDTTVSLYPVWHLYIDPGRVHAVYQADAEPLKDWEELRREMPRPANPPLAMPLTLQSHSAATGYWCFFIGNDLENNKRLQDGRRRVETVLEIHDLASDRRTKSNRFYLEIDLIRSLLSPLPIDQDGGSE
ncbi:MAG: hypothetical protein ACJ76N_02950 [Thermoanaerobaculia bacterium]